MTPQEAEQKLRENPVTTDPEVKTVLVATYGEQKFRAMRQEAGRNNAGNVAVSARGGAPTASMSGTAAPTQYRQPAPAAQPQPVTQDPYGHDTRYQAALDGAEAELMSNPLGLSTASKEILRARWGAAEFSKRRQYALEATGQINMKVTTK